MLRWLVLMETLVTAGSSNSRAPDLFQQALEKHRGGVLLEAKALYDKVHELDPEFPDLHNNVAILHHAMGRIKEAKSWWRKGIKLYPGNQILLNNKRLVFGEAQQKPPKKTPKQTPQQTPKQTPKPPNNGKACDSEEGTCTANKVEDDSMHVQELKTKRFVACGIAHNNAETILNALRSIEKIGALFREWKSIIYENDSSDRTAKILRKWQHRHTESKVTLILETLRRPSAESVDTRIAWLGQYREKYMKVLQRKEFKGFHYVMVVDFDFEMSDPFPVGVVKTTFRNSKHWDVACATGEMQTQHGPILYDTLAFMSERYPNATHAETRANRAAFQLDMQRETENARRNGLQFYPVWSCFGGLAFYKRKSMVKCNYGDSGCEHWNLHQCIRQNGGNVTMNLRMRIGSPQITGTHQKPASTDAVQPVPCSCCSSVEKVSSGVAEPMRSSILKLRSTCNQYWWDNVDTQSRAFIAALASQPVDSHAKHNPKRGKVIPKKLYQTSHLPRSAIPEKVFTAIETYAPEYEHSLWGDADCEEFLAQYFDSAVLNRWHELGKGPYKVDLWRFAMLYIYGGVYLDISVILNQPLEDIFNKNNTWYATMSATRASLHNGLLASPPGNPVFAALVHYMVKLPLTGEFEDQWPHYQSVTRHLLNVATHLYGEVRYGLSRSSFEGVNVELFKERCAQGSVMQRHSCAAPDKYGNCCKIFKRGSWRPAFGSRYHDYPWDEKREPQQLRLVTFEPVAFKQRCSCAVSGTGEQTRIFNVSNLELSS